MHLNLNINYYPVLFLLFLCLNPLYADDKDVKSQAHGVIRYFKGEVSIQKKGEPQKMGTKRLEKFFEGDQIFTGPESFCILKLTDGSTIKLDPGSHLKVEGLIEKNGNSFKGSSYFVLSVGGVMVDVVKKFSGPPSLEIETSNQVSFGVRGTQFYIFYDADTSDVWGTVKEGEVTVMDYIHDDSEVITPGMSLALVEGQTITKPAKYYWSKKLSWSFEETDQSFSTNRESTQSERFQELQSKFKELKRRKKKKFLEQKKNLEESTSDSFRTPLGEEGMMEGTTSSSQTSSKHAGVNTKSKKKNSEGTEGADGDSETPILTVETPPKVDITPKGSGKGTGKGSGHQSDLGGVGIVGPADQGNGQAALERACQQIHPKAFLSDTMCVKGLRQALLGELVGANDRIFYCCFKLELDGNKVNLAP